MTITDEMVEKAASAYLAVRDYESYNPCMRAALEAVAPMLIAQGMRKAVNLMGNHFTEEEIIARAQELELA